MNRSRGWQAVGSWPLLCGEAAKVMLVMAISVPIGTTFAQERDLPTDASGTELSEPTGLEAANARGLTRAAHRESRAEAWAHIRDREYDAAIAVLRDLQAVEFPEDAAFTHQALAAAFNFKRDYERVVHHQSQIVEKPGNLPAKSVRAALMSAGYLSFQQQRFKDAVRYMEDWKDGEENPPARFYAMLARAYSEIGDRSRSVANAKAAMQAAKAEGVSTPEWLQQLAQ